MKEALIKNLNLNRNIRTLMNITRNKEIRNWDNLDKTYQMVEEKVLHSKILRYLNQQLQELRFLQSNIKHNRKIKLLQEIINKKQLFLNNQSSS